MAKYAYQTSVPVDRSKSEIERTLMRYGADKFAYARDTSSTVIGFRFKGRIVKLTLNLPDPKNFELTSRGRERSNKIALHDWERACRQQWRALHLVIKAKLEAVDSGIATFEDEFLAYTCLPNGSSVSEFMQPQIESAIETGKMPKLLVGSVK